MLRITANTGGLIRLRALNVRGGDEDGGGYGGGIYFRGNGRLEIEESQIQFNVGGYGAGKARGPLLSWSEGGYCRRSVGA